MPAIYLASANTVVKISNPKQQPEYPDWLDENWRIVDYAEFKLVRAKIQRRQRGSRRTKDAVDRAIVSEKLNGVEQSAMPLI